MVISGYSYSAIASTDYLSIVVLIVHVLLALGHTLQLIYFKRSSSAWDSIAELLTLSLNSRPPTHVLKNTSAGIDQFDTYKRVTKIRARHEVHADDFTTEDTYKHPEIIFDKIANVTLIEMVCSIPRASTVPVQGHHHAASSSTSSSLFSLHRSYPLQNLSPTRIRKSASDPSLRVMVPDELYGD